MNKRKTGAEYEARAAEYLKGAGYEILERNYRNHFGEIDIIARDVKKDVIVYAEVKYRSSGDFGTSLEAVDYRKQRKISKTAFYHQSFDKRAMGKNCRFDVIGIDKSEGIKHIEGAFDFIE